jgi:hypothetical protein
MFLEREAEGKQSAAASDALLALHHKQPWPLLRLSELLIGAAGGGGGFQCNLVRQFLAQSLLFFTLDAVLKTF